MKVSLDKLPESRPYMYFFNGMILKFILLAVWKHNMS